MPLGIRLRLAECIFLSISRTLHQKLEIAIWLEYLLPVSIVLQLKI